MHRRLTVATVVALFALPATPGYAHTIKVNGKIIDFKGWKGGAKGETDCCDNRHCRVAESYTQLKDGSWEFVVKIHPANAVSPIHRTVVPDREVTKDNPADDANAYWCGDFFLSTDGKYTYTNRCAFIPKLTN